MTNPPDPEWLEDLVSKVRMIARNAQGMTSLGGELISFTRILSIAANQLERLGAPPSAHPDRSGSNALKTNQTPSSPDLPDRVKR